MIYGDSAASEAFVKTCWCGKLRVLKVRKDNPNARVSVAFEAVTVIFGKVILLS